GRMPDALEPMRTAVRLAPTNANSHRVLGQILGHLQHFDDGLAEMYEARRLNPNDANIHNEIGNILLDAFGKFDDALAAYVEARTFLNVHGWARETSQYLAIMAHLGYRQAEMKEEAQAVLEEATKKVANPRWPFAIIRYLKGELNEQELLELAIDNDKKTEA